jgi:hypothetical protein
VDKSGRLFVVFVQGFVDRKNLIAAAAAGRLRGIIPAASFGGGGCKASLQLEEPTT